MIEKGSTRNHRESKQATPLAERRRKIGFRAATARIGIAASMLLAGCEVKSGQETAPSGTATP